MLGVRVCGHILVASGCRSWIVLQLDWTGLIKELRVIVLVSSNPRGATDLGPLLGSSLTSDLRWEHLAVEEGQVRWLNAHTLHVLNHACGVCLVRELLRTVVWSVYLHVVLGLVLVPLSKVVHKLTPISRTLTPQNPTVLQKSSLWANAVVRLCLHRTLLAALLSVDLIRVLAWLFARLHRDRVSLRIGVTVLLTVLMGQLLLTINKRVLSVGLCLLLWSLAANWARLYLLIIHFDFMLFEHLFSRLDTTLFRGNIDKVAVFHNSGWHFTGISDNKVVNVVVIDDVGDGARSLLHMLLTKTAILLHISDWCLFLLVLFSLHEVVGLFLGVLRWDHLSLLFLLGRLGRSRVFVFEVTHLKRLYHILFRFSHFNFFDLRFGHHISSGIFFIEKVVFTLALLTLLICLCLLLSFCSVTYLDCIWGQLQWVFTDVLEIRNSCQAVHIEFEWLNRGFFISWRLFVDLNRLYLFFLVKIITWFGCDKQWALRRLLIIIYPLDGTRPALVNSFVLHMGGSHLGVDKSISEE